MLLLISRSMGYRPEDIYVGAVRETDCFQVYRLRCLGIDDVEVVDELTSS